MRRFAIGFISFLAASSSAFAYQNALWIPGWGSAQLNSIQLHAGVLNESNPVWYGWNSDGTLTKKSNAENPTWRAAMTGTRVMPTVQNTTSKGFDGAATVTVLATAASRESHAAVIAQLAASQAYDGIDIDYESVPTASRANFTAFLTTLATKLHAAGKKLSVCVYGKTSDSQNWDGPGSQDWSAIGQIADSVKIMAYDYHWSTSVAGPIAPLDWLDQIASYAERAIPASKIIMGLPWYGYDWSGTSGADATYASAMANAQNAGATITHDVNGEATYTYNGRTVYFQDATSYQKKLDMLKQKHSSIGGFTAWAAGMEDPEIWNIIAGTSTTPATPAPADFTVAGPTTVTAFLGATRSAAFSVVPINGFSAATTVSTVLPSGFQGTVIPAASSAMPNVAVSIRVTVSSGTMPGTYPVTVRFMSGALVHQQVLNVSVVAASAGVQPTPTRSRAVRSSTGAAINQ